MGERELHPPTPRSRKRNAGADQPGKAREGSLQSLRGSTALNMPEFRLLASKLENEFSVV